MSCWEAQALLSVLNAVQALPPGGQTTEGRQPGLSLKTGVVGRLRSETPPGSLLSGNVASAALFFVSLLSGFDAPVWSISLTSQLACALFRQRPVFSLKHA